MAQQFQGKFGYKTVKLIKTEPLGTGSCGAVYKAMCDDLLCAGKILHSTLFQPNDPGAMATMRRFQQECCLLSALRHPNIVQYLGSFQDPETQLPVLLMELMYDNLTKFLERSQEPLPYHTQVNICHDIALALAYLHSNSIIHRDLSSNNVLLMSAGNTAKVTDFGMAKLFNINCATMTPLTMCPGTLAYMSPEALDDPPVYTKKLDTFSFGVLDVQIITRQLPDPGPRMKKVQNPSDPKRRLQEVVLETERRKSHIDLIVSTHPLLPIANDCLNYNEEDRPSAQDLCQRIAALKETSQYGDSVKQAREKPTSAREDKHLKLSWNSSEAVGHKMCRGSATVCGSMAYFRPAFSPQVYSYNSHTDKWSPLTECPKHSVLTVIRGFLTAVGGEESDNHKCTNTLLSLVDGNWANHFPPMPTKRKKIAVVRTEKALIVAGGIGDGDSVLATVEVMDTDTLQWSTVSSLPQPLCDAIATVCGDAVHLVGGQDQYWKSTALVFTCRLSTLLQSQTNEAKTNVLSLWDTNDTLPVIDSTCATLNGQLVAVGGKDSDNKATNNVYSYDAETNSWEVISHMPTARFWCLVAVLPGNKLMVVGGCTPHETNINKVEVAIVM